jgi:flagellin-like hook-associated protein FlgL
LAVSLDNTGAALALQPLSAAQSAVAASERRLSTGQKVQDARDDGAAYIISRHIQDSISKQTVLQQTQMRARSLLDITQSSVGDVSDLLSQMREKALALTDTSLDTASQQALRNDIDALNTQIDRSVSNASFNGTNLLIPDPVPYPVGSANSVNAPMISGSFTVNNNDIDGRLQFSFGFRNTQPGVTMVDFGDGAGPQYYVGANGASFLHDYKASPGTYTVSYQMSVTGWTNTGHDGIDFAQPVFSPFTNATLINANADGTSLQLLHKALSSGSLGLRALDAMTPVQMLGAIGAALDTANLAAAYYGTKQNIVDTLITSTGKTIDAYQKGYGDLVDADMGRDSATWQAAQARVSLATQALSIANHSPKILLSLFPAAKQ